MHCGGTCEAREKEVRFCLELWNKYPPSIYKDLKRGALRAQEILEKLRAPAHRVSGGWARAAILLAGGRRPIFTLQLRKNARVNRRKEKNGAAPQASTCSTRRLVLVFGI